MKRKNLRRRVKKRKGAAEKTRMKFSAIVGIMFMAVLLGFLTARFIIGPMIGYDSDTSPAKTVNSASDSDLDSSSDSDEDSEDGYALQFGAFSTKDAAEELVSNLEKKGIECEIRKDESMYKVISPLIDKKDDALEQLGDLSDEDVEDVFIAKF